MNFTIFKLRIILMIIVVIYMPGNVIQLETNVLFLSKQNVLKSLKFKNYHFIKEHFNLP